MLVEDTRNCYLYASDRLLATVGLDDCIVVETKDAVLVAPKDRGQDVKKLVEALKAQRPRRGRAAPGSVPPLGQL